MNRAGAGIEREVALLIVSADSTRTLRRLAALREIAGYHLAPEPVQNIVDTYYDTPDHDLGARRIGLRVRRVGRRTLATYKTPAAARGGGPARGEYEAPIATAIPWIARQLERLGIERSGKPPRTLRQLVEAFDLVPTQRRRTRRVVRNVVKPGASRAVVAELALDSVRYDFGRSAVRLDEVEIEAKGPGGDRAVDAVADVLLEQFDGELRRWPHSKLTTGLRLERAVRRGTLSLRRDRRLTPRGLASLSRSLARTPR